MTDKYIAGVDIGGTKIAVAIAKQDGKIVFQNTFPTNPALDPFNVIDNLVNLISRISTENQFPVSAIGIACCGPLDLERGVVVSPPNLPLWREFPLHEIVQQRFGVPVALENDANAAALGEHLFGAGREFDDIVYLTISTGIGCGIVAGGKLVHRSGEGGHIIVQSPSDRVCGCGAYGCMEALCSGTGIAARTRQFLRDARPSTLKINNGNEDTITARTVVEAMRAGDELCTEVWREVIAFMSIGIGSLITVMAPQAVILGGSVAIGANQDLLRPLKHELRNQVKLVGLEKVEILLAGLGADSALHGALAIAARIQTATV